MTCFLIVLVEFSTCSINICAMPSLSADIVKLYNDFLQISLKVREFNGDSMIDGGNCHSLTRPRQNAKKRRTLQIRWIIRVGSFSVIRSKEIQHVFLKLLESFLGDNEMSGLAFVFLIPWLIISPKYLTDRSCSSNEAFALSLFCLTVFSDFESQTSTADERAEGFMGLGLRALRYF